MEDRGLIILFLIDNENKHELNILYKFSIDTWIQIHDYGFVY